MNHFLHQWSEAAYTSIGFFWMALWAFIFGYLLCSLIQVMISRRRMRRAMGDGGPASMGLATFFGFLSSSCSFAALATTRALFNKGASFPASMAFMLASTNLVIELGFVIAIFLGWQFVVGEYVGGLLLILLAWVFISLTRPNRLIAQARHKDEDQNGETEQRKPLSALKEKSTWQEIAGQFVMEWQMVWKDVLIGFTVAGMISAFVPRAFFEWLFLGLGSGADAGFWEILQQTLIGPVAAFFTFIGSMGNIPLAAVLFGEGVAFAGVMAFIFSDLVVLPVLRINAQYYGWKMSLYIAGMLYTCLVIASLLMHYALALTERLPDHQNWSSPADRNHFVLDGGFILNVLFLIAAAVMVILWRSMKQAGDHHHHHDHGGQPSLSDRILQGISLLSGLWLVAGMGLYLLN